jgi:hypothetical protein
MVDFPAPEGPMMADTSPVTEEVGIGERKDRAREYDFGTMKKGERRRGIERTSGEGSRDVSKDFLLRRAKERPERSPFPSEGQVAELHRTIFEGFSTTVDMGWRQRGDVRRTSTSIFALGKSILPVTVDSFPRSFVGVLLACLTPPGCQYWRRSWKDRDKTRSRS